MPPTTATAPARRRANALPGVVGVLTVLAALGLHLLDGTATLAAGRVHLTGSSPASSAVVSGPPQLVTLTFSEHVAVRAGSLKVLGPDGERVDTGRLVNLCSGDTVRYGTPLRDGLHEGTYTVAWQARSGEGQRLSGSRTFFLGSPSDLGSPPEAAFAPPKTHPRVGGTAGLVHDAARYAAHVGLPLLVGGAALVLACWPAGARNRGVRRLVAAGWLTLTTATLALLVTLPPESTDGGTDAGSGAGLDTVLLARLLLLAVAAPLGAALFTGAGRVPRRRGRLWALLAAGAVVATGLGTTWLMSGHAGVGPQTEIAGPVHVLHLLALAVWLGGLATLAHALSGGGPGEPRVCAPAARRITRVCLGAVAVVSATGLFRAWRLTGSWSALAGTEYGRLSLVGFALVAGLIWLTWSAHRATRRLNESTEDDSGDMKGGGETGGAEPGPTAMVDAGPSGRVDTGPGPEAARPGDEHPAEPHVLDPHSPDVHGTDVHDPDVHDPVRAAQLARQRTAREIARRRQDRDADPRRARLRRTALTGVGVAVALLAVTTTLAGTTPARTAEATQAAQAAQALTDSSVAVPDRPIDLRVPFDTGGQRGRGTASLTLDPGRSGRNTLEVRVTGPSGRPLDVADVRVILTPSGVEGDAEPLPVTPERTEAGTWRRTDVRLPAPGSWDITLTVHTSGGERAKKTMTVTIG